MQSSEEELKFFFLSPPKPLCCHLLLSASAHTVYVQRASKATVCSTHQLELPAPIVSVLDALVGPQGPDGWQVVLEDFGLHHAVTVGHGGSGVERHHGLPVLLVGRVAPRDVKLLPRVHQHPDTCGDARENFLVIRKQNPIQCTVAKKPTLGFTTGIQRSAGTVFNVY